MMGYPEAMTYQNYSDMIRHLNVLWLIPIGVGAVYLLMLPPLIVFLRDRWRGLLLGYAAMFLTVRLWLIVITTSWLLILSATLDSERMAKVLNEVLRSGKYVSLIWLDVLVIALVFTMSYAGHGWKSRAKRTTARDARYSRLIVPTPVLILPLGLSCFLAAAVIVCDCPMSPAYCEISPCLAMTLATRLILEYAGLILVIGGVLIQSAHGGFKVITDIVNYFKTDVAHTRANPIAAMALAYSYDPRSEASFGARLRSRFLTICKDLTADAGGVDRLYVVAHSLGTVIALDALRSDRGVPSLPGVEFNLFTMGSPYKNIFNFYFPHLFPVLGREQLPSVSALTNIYRENDYVGTLLSDGDGFVTERRKGRKGHFGYFEDPDVVWELFRFG